MQDLFSAVSTTEGVIDEYRQALKQVKNDFLISGAIQIIGVDCSTITRTGCTVELQLAFPKCSTGWSVDTTQWVHKAHKKKLNTTNRINSLWKLLILYDATVEVQATLPVFFSFSF